MTLGRRGSEGSLSADPNTMGGPGRRESKGSLSVRCPALVDVIFQTKDVMQGGK